MLPQVAVNPPTKISYDYTVLDEEGRDWKT